MTRQIIVDTETSGLEYSQGHRVIEIGCVEMIDRRLSGRTFHHYINPQREIDEAASEVHGITDADLKDKPLFADLAEELLAFVDGAELIIHNAPFDVGFLNNEFKLSGFGDGVIESHCTVTDTLAMARELHPGGRGSLDALCKRYDVDNTQRTLHGALLDAEILADVYLAMTGGQAELLGEAAREEEVMEVDCIIDFATPFIRASDEELAAHNELLRKFAEAAPGDEKEVNRKEWWTAW